MNIAIRFIIACIAYFICDYIGIIIANNNKTLNKDDTLLIGVIFGVVTTHLLDIFFSFFK